MRGAPRLPAMDAVLTMAASSDWRSAPTAARLMRKTPLTLTAKMRSHCASANSSSAPLSTTPALLTSTSRPPKASTAAATACSQDAASVTSTDVERTSPKGAISSTAAAISALEASG